MKRNLLLLAVMVLAFSGTGMAACPQAPNDNGNCDTLYMEVWPADSVFDKPGPDFARIALYVTNDVPDPMIDSIAAFVIPLCYTHTNSAKYCSLSSYLNRTSLAGATFPRSIFRNLPDGQTTWMKDFYDQDPSYVWANIILNLDGTSHFWFYMIPTTQPLYGGVSHDYTAVMTFKLEDSMQICIDTCFWPPSSRVAFYRKDAVSYMPRIWDDMGRPEVCNDFFIIPNLPPTFTCPANQSHNTNGIKIATGVDVVDPDCPSISTLSSWSASFAGSGVDPLSVQFVSVNQTDPCHWTADVQYNVTDHCLAGGVVTVTASDNQPGGTGQCTFNITLTDTAPVITNCPLADSVIAGQQYSYDVNANDIDALTFSGVGNPGGDFTINATTGVITWHTVNPDDIGDHPITVIVTEEGGTCNLADTCTFHIKVLPPPPYGCCETALGCYIIPQWDCFLAGGIWFGSTYQCIGTHCAPPTTNWTILVYMNGDNDLESAAIDDINEMEMVGSSAQVNIIVQVDRIPGFDASNGNWTDTRRYYIVNDTVPVVINSTRLDTLPFPLPPLGELNMGAPQTLANFVNWGIYNYPARYYAVVVWDHGNGWYKKPFGEDFYQDDILLKGMSWDYTDSANIGVSDGEWEYAISAIKNYLERNIDLYGFDACLMQMWEVMDITDDYADYMVGPEAEENFDGWYYTQFLDSLTTYPTMLPERLGSEIVDAAVDGDNQKTQSCVKLAQISALTTAVDNFACELINANDPIVQGIRSQLDTFYTFPHIDLYDFADSVYRDTRLPINLTYAANNVMTAVDSAVTWNRTQPLPAYDWAEGIAIYYPTDPSFYDSRYDSLPVAKNTGWDDFIGLIPGGPGGVVNLEVKMWGFPRPRRGFIKTYWVRYSNLGSAYACNVVLTVTLPPEVQYKVGSCNPFCNVNGQTISWNLGTVGGYDSGLVRVDFNIPADAPLEKVLLGEAEITTTSPDVNLTNNRVEERELVVGSKDPNDKEAQPWGSCLAHFISPDQTITYTIFFENDSSASAEAIYIDIVDTLDANLDWSTLEFGPMSHPDPCQATFDSISGILTWDCDNIMLPPNDSAPEGEGFVGFSIKPDSGLAFGTQIKNRAYIKFDFNDWVAAPDSGPVIRTIGFLGDVNGDGVINLGDVVYLISYLYKNGPAPAPLEAGDVNCNGVVDLGDVVYLIRYLYQGGPPPCEDKGTASPRSGLELYKGKAPAQIGFSSPIISKDGFFEASVMCKTDVDVAAVGLEIKYDPKEISLLEPALTPRTKGLQVYSSAKDGVQKMGIVDITGDAFISAGTGALANLKGKGSDLTSLEISQVILVDKDAHELPAQIVSTMKESEDEAEKSAMPQEFSLSMNRPNPFNPETEISYALPTDCQVKLTIYNVAGQKVTTLVDEHQTAGYKTSHWNGKDEQGKEVASGVYFYKIVAGDFVQSKKMLLMK